jgi:Plasmid pRiA4b ORF-3-like protein
MCGVPGPSGAAGGSLAACSAGRSRRCKKRTPRWSPRISTRSCRSRSGCWASARWCGGACGCRQTAPCASCMVACFRSRRGGRASTSIIPSARRSVRLLGTVGVFAGCVLGGVSAPQRSAVCLRVRPEHPLAPRSLYRSAATVDAGQDLCCAAIKVRTSHPDCRATDLPTCTSGNGACPPEDCGGPASFMHGRDGMLSLNTLDDLETMVEIVGQVERRPEIFDDDETRWRLERAVERSQAREHAQGRPFSRRAVNARLGRGEHRDLMHRQC